MPEKCSGYGSARADGTLSIVVDSSPGKPVRHITLSDPYSPSHLLKYERMATETSSNLARTLQYRHHQDLSLPYYHFLVVLITHL
jgi:hypothetical protein